MVEMPEELKEIVVSVVRKPLFILIGLTFTTTFTTGLLIGRWYGSRKIRQYNKREDLHPKPKFNWGKFKFWERKSKDVVQEQIPEQVATAETASINEPCGACEGFGLPDGETCPLCEVTGRG